MLQWTYFVIDLMALTNSGLSQPQYFCVKEIEYHKHFIVC